MAVPSRLWGDHGPEKLKVATWMEEKGALQGILQVIHSPIDFQTRADGYLM